MPVMFQSLMTRRYLTSRVMPWLAVIAVMLCTAMVLTVWSVMSGFLGMLLASGRTMSGDVTIARPVRGLAHYEALVEALEADPGIEAASATVETIALVSLTPEQMTSVRLIGIDPDSFHAVTSYRDHLWWRRPPMSWSLQLGDGPARASEGAAPIEVEWGVTSGVSEVRASIDLPEGAPGPLRAYLIFDDRVMAFTSFNEAGPFTEIEIEASVQVPDPAGRWSVEVESDDLRYEMPAEVGEAGESLRWGLGGEAERDAIVLGIRIWALNEWVRGEGDTGYFRPLHGSLMPGREAELWAPALSAKGALADAGIRRLRVANEFRTGLVFTDREWVLMPLGVLQRMLRLESGEIAGPPVVTRDENGNVVITTGTGEMAPARATHIVVRGAEGTTPKATLEVCREVYAAFAAAHDDAPSEGQVSMYTWDQRPGIATFIAAVRKETSLVLVLFGVVSLTPAFLVFTIFWSMVSEKTKDIGVLRAIGAGRGGVGWLFLRYGLMIGVTGGVMGISLAVVIVVNFNTIHAWLGERMGVVVWDPAVYAFERLPSEVHPLHAALVFISGILVCGLGAVVPAVRAALMDPVRAIRFE